MDMEADSVQGQTEFALELHKAVVKGKEGANVVLSPLSVGLALAMIAAGAKGPTRAQIAQCLKLPEGEPMHKFASKLRTNVLADASGDGGPQLTVANRAWFDKSVKLKPQFQAVLKDCYGSEAASADFGTKAEEALGEVNDWAKKQTHGKIEELLPSGSVDSNTRLVVANGLYFKGEWQRAFESHRTSEGDFFLLDGKVIKVPMMHTTTKRCVRDFGTFKALRLPYESSTERPFSMFILLPHERTGLSALEAALNAGSLTDILKHVHHAVPMRKFALPKFKVTCGFEVSAALEALRLTLPFGDQADLSDMVESPAVGKSLYVSSVFHKTFVEVDEKGTEAAAATAAIVMTKSANVFEDPPQDFVCDHPFLFVLKEEVTNVILFTGRITDPSTQE